MKTLKYKHTEALTQSWAVYVRRPDKLPGPECEELPQMRGRILQMPGRYLWINKRNKSDNGAEYFICYPYSLWEKDTEM